jgi:hypothetical protein
MSRRNTQVDEVETVTEDVETVAEGTEPTAPKAKKEPARGELPEGYVTPVGFAKIVTERELHTARDGSHDVKPQMVYSYIKNSPKEDAFPLQTVTDSLGHERQAVLIEDGVAWWARKNERVGNRKANAEAKATAKAERAAAKATEDASTESTEEVTEAE